ncbi:MAG: NUDIX domain-containing protein [Aquificaceae bacterium]|nr:NUDIX domain-containing protein [Aquificaceae bacterium]
MLFKGRELLLVRSPSGVWTFPKGLVEAGENPEETALREVLEETGVRGRIVTPLGEINYWYVREGEKIKKKVVLYLMDYVEGEPKPSWEVKEARFVPVEEVSGLLKYKGDREVFEKAIKVKAL